MPDIRFSRFDYNLVLKKIDLINDTIKVALFSSTLTPNNLNQNVWSDISSYEITGSGYSTGGITLTGKSVIQDTTYGGAVFTASNINWPSSTLTARYAILYDATLTNKDLICSFDFVSDKISNGTDFIIAWNSQGILRIF